jgi:hypothetical protein
LRMAKDYLDSIFDLTERIQRQRTGHQQKKDQTSKAAVSKMGIPILGTPTKRFCKVYNWVLDELPKIMKPSEWLLYIQLYRLSIGYNRPSCVIGYGALANRTGLGKNTVIRGIETLVNMGLIIARKTDGEGTEYILGVPKMGIPKTGIPKMGIPNNEPEGIPKMGIPNMGIPSSNSPQAGLNEGIPKMGIPNMGTLQIHSTKDNNKDTLDMLLSLNIHEEKARALIDHVTYEKLEMLISFAYDPEMHIKNKPGWVVRAIEDEYALPDDWVHAQTKKQQRKKAAASAEQRAIAEKRAFEKWLANITEETKSEAIEYANKELANMKIEIREEIVREQMWNGFCQEYLEQKFKQERGE